MDMDVQYDTYRERAAETVRRLDAPRPVRVAEWHPGSVLDAGVNENGEWWGRFRDPAGRLHGHPATSLQPDDNQ